MPRREAHAAFCLRFGRDDVTLVAYKALCKRKGWLTGRTGCFPKGHVPGNKGRKMPFNPNCARTQFKKGNRTGRANHTYKPVGTEVLRPDGYVWRKINEGLPFHHRWKQVHVLNWEAANGPVPAGHFLKCLDGNRTNTAAENWEALPNSMKPRLAGRWSLGYDAAPDELKPAVMATAKLEHAVREARKGQR